MPILSRKKLRKGGRFSKRAVGRVDDRDLDRGLELAAQLDELQEDEGGRTNGALSYADGLDGGEDSTLADEDDFCKGIGCRREGENRSYYSSF